MLILTLENRVFQQVQKRQLAEIQFLTQVHSITFPRWLLLNINLKPLIPFAIREPCQKSASRPDSSCVTINQKSLLGAALQTHTAAEGRQDRV
jgi:hypothetical protein